jgi:hypothetical protein
MNLTAVLVVGGGSVGADAAGPVHGRSALDGIRLMGCQKQEQGGKSTAHISPPSLTLALTQTWLWNHTALEQLVGDRPGDSVNEFLPHVRIFMKESHEALLHAPLLSGSRVGALRRKLLAGRRLVFVDDPGSELVQHRILLGTNGSSTEA